MAEITFTYQSIPLKATTSTGITYTVGDLIIYNKYSYASNYKKCLISRYNNNTGLTIKTNCSIQSNTLSTSLTPRAGFTDVQVTISGGGISVTQGSKSYTYSSNGIKVDGLSLSYKLTFGKVTGTVGAKSTTGGQTLSGTYSIDPVTETKELTPSNAISQGITKEASFSSKGNRTLLMADDWVKATATINNSGAPYSSTSEESDSLNRASYEAFRLVSTYNDWSTKLSEVDAQAKSYPDKTTLSVSASFDITKSLRGKSFYPGFSGENMLYSGTSQGRYTGKKYGSKYTVNSLPRITNVTSSGIDQTNTATITVEYTDADGFSSGVAGKYISDIQIQLPTNSSINIPVSNIINSSYGVCTATADFTQLVQYKGSISSAAEVDLLLSIKDGLEWSYTDGSTTEKDRFSFKPDMNLGYIRANTGSGFQKYPILVNIDGHSFIKAKEIHINNGSKFVSQILS